MPRYRVAVAFGLFLVGLLPAAPVLAQKYVELPKSAGTAPGIYSEASEPIASPLFSAPAANNGWRFWVNADYAVAWLSPRNLPPLATTSPAGTAKAAAGVLGLPGTTTVLGASPITDEPRSMGRLSFGLWFDQDRSLGLETGFVVAASKGRSFGVSSDGNTILARPFTDATNGAPTSVLVGFPGNFSGSVNAFAASQTFCGTNFALKETIASESWLHMEALFGYRYLHYGESLDMQQNLTLLAAPFVPGTTIVSNDSFRTTNDFHAFDFGFRTELFWQSLSLEVLTKAAAGHMHRLIIINGSEQKTEPGKAAVNNAGGVYALVSNIGTHGDHSWVVAPELGLTLGYQLSSNVRLRLGYSLLFMPDIARAGDQIDFTLNKNLFPPATVGVGPNRPGVPFATSEMWIQSFNVGVELKY
jgi:hypothetical protein